MEKRMLCAQGRPPAHDDGLGARWEKLKSFSPNVSQTGVVGEGLGESLGRKLE
jgi:hypothetical protein